MKDILMLKKETGSKSKKTDKYNILKCNYTMPHD